MTAAQISTLCIVGAAAILIALERWRPYDARQSFLRPGLVSDLLCYTLIQNWVCGLIIAAVIAWMRAHVAADIQFVRHWPFAVQAVIFLVLHDAYIYAFHRLQHNSPLLWRIHEAHHSTREVDWLSGTRSHILEILINQTIEFAPLALLGASAEVWWFKVTIDAVWGMYIHSNIDVRSGRLQRFINGPEMHRWHHATDIVNVNYSTKLAIWDWLFGTAYLPDRKPSGYGIAGAGGEYPCDYVRQTLRAFAPT